MLTREECEKACLYLLEHCYETNAPILENGNKNRTYTFTPSGFKESEIFKNLIEEHFNPQPLKFEEIHENMWVFDMYIKCAIYITKIENNCINNEYKHFENPIEHELFCNICGENKNQTYFEEGRFYPITILNVGDSK